MTRRLLAIALTGAAVTGFLHETVHAQAPEAEPYTWCNVTLIAGGFVPGIVFHPAEPRLMYCRTDIGGAYRWDSAAQAWIPLNDWAGQKDWNLLGIESIGPDPNDPDRVYLAAGTYTNDWAGNGAILRSEDRGATWRRADLSFKLGGNEDGRSIGERLAVDPGNGDVIFFGSRRNGLWKSADRGATWSRVESFPDPGPDNRVGIGFVKFGPQPGVLYAGVAVAGASLYRSTDAGTTWSVIPGTPEAFIPHHAAFTPDGGTLFITYSNGPGPNNITDGGVLKLDTASDIWTDITPVKPSESDKFGYAGLSLDASDPKTLVVSTIDRWTVGDDIFRSTDGGETWLPLREKSSRDASLSPYLSWGRDRIGFGHWIGDVEIDPHNPNHALYVTGATLWGTQELRNIDDGRSVGWSVAARGIEETAVLELISPPRGPSLISGLGDIGGFRHDSLDRSPPRGMWTNPYIHNTDGLDFAELEPDVVVRVGRADPGERGAISTDGAITWNPFASEPPGDGSGSIAVSADAAVIVWTPRNGRAHFTLDRGTTWTACEGLPEGVAPVADRVKSQVFHAFDHESGRLHASEDGGASFAVVAEGSPSERGVVKVAPGVERGVWIAAGKDGLLRLDLESGQLQRITGVDSVQGVGFGKPANGRTYPALFITGTIADVAGIFRSDDEGSTWIRVNDDAHQWGWLGDAITGDPRIYGRVYVGTNGRGILYGEPVKP